jgi:hypothetical protein
LSASQDFLFISYFLLCGPTHEWVLFFFSFFHLSPSLFSPSLVRVHGLGNFIDLLLIQSVPPQWGLANIIVVRHVLRTNQATTILLPLPFPPLYVSSPVPPLCPPSPTASTLLPQPLSHGRCSRDQLGPFAASTLQGCTLGLGLHRHPQ